VVNERLSRPARGGDPMAVPVQSSQSSGGRRSPHPPAAGTRL